MWFNLDESLANLLESRFIASSISSSVSSNKSVHFNHEEAERRIYGLIYC